MITHTRGVGGSSSGYIIEVVYKVYNPQTHPFFGLRQLLGSWCSSTDIFTPCQLPLQQTIVLELLAPAVPLCLVPLQLLLTEGVPGSV